MHESQTFSYQVASFRERRSGWFILAILAITALLAIPMVVLAPDEQASDNPGGAVYDLQDLVSTTFSSRVHGAFQAVPS